MPIVRYMTPEEEKEFPGSAGIFRRGEGSPDIVAIREGMSPESKGMMLRHEIGHAEYPIEIEVDLSDFPKFVVQKLLDELVANYFTLKGMPKESHPKESIKVEKGWARLEGMSSKQISRVDRLAREIVNYLGKEIVER